MENKYEQKYKELALEYFLSGDSDEERLKLFDKLETLSKDEIRAHEMVNEVPVAEAYESLSHVELYDIIVNLEKMMIMAHKEGIESGKNNLTETELEKLLNSFVKEKLDQLKEYVSKQKVGWTGDSIELDNLDKAKLTQTIQGPRVLNCSGTLFELYELSNEEIKMFHINTNFDA